MAEKVQGVDFPSRGAKAKYDWDAWLDGDTWKLVQGEDFTVTTASFRSLVHQHATKRGLTANVKVDGAILYVKASPICQPIDEDTSATLPPADT